MRSEAGRPLAPRCYCWVRESWLSTAGGDVGEGGAVKLGRSLDRSAYPVASDAGVAARKLLFVQQQPAGEGVERIELAQHR